MPSALQAGITLITLSLIAKKKWSKSECFQARPVRHKDMLYGKIEIHLPLKKSSTPFSQMINFTTF